MTDFTAVRISDRPDLLPAVKAMYTVWDAFMLEDPIANQHFHRLYEWFADCQLALCDETGAAVGRMLCVPIRWNGDDASLPDQGWDWALLNGVETYEAGLRPTAVSAIEITVLKNMQGRGLSSVALNAMKDNVRALGYERLVAPVRPNLKPSYPLTPMQNYITWTKDDSGAPFDPWLRVHWRDGARIARVASHSMTIPATIAEWEERTGMRFPESGQYIVPGALSPVTMDVEADLGTYVEPNVWMVHSIDS